MSWRYLRLIGVLAAVLLVWGVILPRLAATHTVEQRIRWLDDHGIDPAAMYYTELPLMDDVLDRVEGRGSQGLQ